MCICEARDHGVYQFASSLVSASLLWETRLGRDGIENGQIIYDFMEVGGSKKV